MTAVIPDYAQELLESITKVVVWDSTIVQISLTAKFSVGIECRIDYLDETKAFFILPYGSLTLPKEFNNCMELILKVPQDELVNLEVTFYPNRDQISSLSEAISSAIQANLPINTL